MYATATLSGDVASALSLLKRLTKPSSRKAKSGLLIPAEDLATCEVLPPPPYSPPPSPSAVTI